MRISGILRRFHWIDALYEKQEFRTLRKNSVKIDERIRRKRNSGEKIRVVFVCHRPAVWGALKTVYETMKQDPLFDPVLIAVPKRNWDKEHGIEDEGAYAVLKEQGAVNGYDEATKTFMDLEALRPDYVFFQQPYNVIMPEQYHTEKVSRYARICYVSYFAHTPNFKNTELTDECWDRRFMRSVSYIFSQNEEEKEYVEDLLRRYNNSFAKCILTGYPKYDDMESARKTESSVWKNPHEGRFRILWTPRWSTSENNCHFFEYKDAFLKHAEEHPDEDLAFRPHPQMWFEFAKTGEFTAEQVRDLKMRYNTMRNVSVDENADFYSTFWSSDVLISDVSSMIVQYLITGKPLIYTYKWDTINRLHKTGSISDVVYWADDWRETEALIEKLKQGDDPLKEKRERYIRENLSYDANVTAAEKIVSYLKQCAENGEYL